MKYINDSGIWKKSIQYINENGTWRRVKNVSSNVNNIWKSTTPPIGTFIEGGFVAGIMDTLNIGGERYLLLVSPKSYEANKQWSVNNGLGSVATSNWNGLENTTKLATSQFPAAKYCWDLVIDIYNDWYLPAIDELELIYRNLKPTQLLNEMNFNNSHTIRNKSFVYPDHYHGYNPSSDPIGEPYYNINTDTMTWATQHTNPLFTGKWPHISTTYASPLQTTIDIFKENQSESFWPPRNLMSQRFAYVSSTYRTDYYNYKTFFYTVACGNEWAKSGGQYKEQYGTNQDLHYVRPVRRILI